MAALRTSIGGLTLAAAVSTAAALAWAPAAVAAPSETTCRDVEVPVTVGSHAGAVAGTLCVPPGARTVQILVAGNTYDRSYWQADVDPATYSYVRRANLAGYATLALDRLGTGASLHPPSAAMTFANGVRTVHDVVTAVRVGAFGQFDRVVGVGHSLGSIVVNQVAGEYADDFDALVLTGFSHSINFVNAAARVAPGYALATGLDPFYVTTQPGGRRGFYAADAVAPDVLAWDDRTRDTANLVEIVGFGGFQFPNASAAVDLPVFVVDGSDDAVACGLLSGDCATSEQLADAERLWFGPDAEVAAWAVPGLGHAVTLHRNAPAVHAGITAWIDDAVGAGAGTRGSAPGAIPSSATRTTAADPATEAANQVLLAGTPLLVDAYVDAVGPVPGLGDGSNPVPAYNELLRTAANLGGPPTG